jgi:predicted esterase
MKRRVLTVVALLAAAATINPVAAHAGSVRFLDPVFAGVQSTFDIDYGRAPDYAGVQQDLRLDLYQPVGDTAARRPVFIWAHGGFFTQGNKSQIGSIRDFMTKRGWVTISIDYRLDPRLPEGVAGYSASDQLPLDLARLGEAARNGQHDMQTAVRWVRAHAAQYRLDSNRIATGGHSAGGTMSIDTAWNSDDPGASGNPGFSSRITAAVATGPTNFVFVNSHPDPAVEPPVANFHWDQDDAPKETQQVDCLVARAMLNVCVVHAYPGAGHTSTVGMNDWLPFLYKWVVTRTTPPHAIKPGTAPTIPAVHVPSSAVPTLPGVPIV